jgi:hypothetical protein
MFDVCTLGHTAHIEAIVQFLPHSDQHAAVLNFFLYKGTPLSETYWYQHLMLLGDGESLLNRRRNARWTETIDSCFTNCSTQNAFCSGVTIIAVTSQIEREVGSGNAHAHKTNTCCFTARGKLTFVCVFKTVMADWNRSNHSDTPCSYIYRQIIFPFLFSWNSYSYLTHNCQQS